MSEKVFIKKGTHTQIQIATLPDDVLMPQEGIENKNKGKTYQFIKQEGLKEISRQEEESLKKTNIPAAEMSSNFDSETDEVDKLAEKARFGEDLTHSELLKLAEHYDMLKLVRLYRHSGEMFNQKPKDIKDEFIEFVRSYSFKGGFDVAYVINSIKKAERTVESWDVLMGWVNAWQERFAIESQYESWRISKRLE
ncbi:hypothetical protein [Nostoc sp. ChiVER01]|uniref:hypothetical protein n=1 Tax=Nostoc sp. ChiVER01 TaxID=3075382 RepID=UPI002AD4E3CB|nr:hypothetical protein [Nostoc sp. ChiVER01]MDZ8227891.1 hypothetical protein [Nostoc sp. ChiVER01]